MSQDEERPTEDPGDAEPETSDEPSSNSGGPPDGSPGSAAPSGAAPGVYTTAWGLYLLLSIGAILWIGRREGGIHGGVFFDPSAWFVDIALGLATAGLWVLLWGVLEQKVAAARKLQDRFAEILGELTPSEALGLALLSGFGEELLFRGAIQGSIGIFWATVLFASLHAGPGRDMQVWGLTALVAGAWLGGLTIWRDNLSAAIVAHTVFNAAGLLRISREARSRAVPESPEEPSSGEP